MTDPATGPHPVLVALIAGFVGLVGGYAFHELAGLRPFVPPIMSGGASMACGDLDAYVQHVSDLSDHRRHDALVGIHRRATIDAVNELYDRARCNPVRDDLGHETYQQFRAKAVDDVNDPGPHAALEPPRPYPLYSHGVLVAPATAAGQTVTQPVRAPTTIIKWRRRSVTIADDLNQAGTPAGAASVGTLGPTPRAYTTADSIDGSTPAWANPDPNAPPPHCVIYKPGQINYGQPAGCR